MLCNSFLPTIILGCSRSNFLDFCSFARFSRRPCMVPGSLSLALALALALVGESEHALVKSKRTVRVAARDLGQARFKTRIVEVSSFCR